MRVSRAAKLGFCPVNGQARFVRFAGRLVRFIGRFALARVFAFFLGAMMVSVAAECSAVPS